MQVVLCWYTIMMPHNPKTKMQRPYDKLVELILRGEIREDQPISERKIAETLDIGRTPIREAVRDLVRDGVLESHPTRGTTLRSLTLVDLQELYEIRFAIEGLAAFLAAERGRVEELEPFAEAFEATLANATPSDISQVHDCGVDFHHAIVKISGNERLLEMYQPFRLRFRIPFGLIRKNSPQRVLTAVSEHHAIWKAISTRDAEHARDLMCEHLQNGLQCRMDMLLKRSSYPNPRASNPSHRSRSKPSP